MAQWVLVFIGLGLPVCGKTDSADDAAETASEATSGTVASSETSQLSASSDVGEPTTGATPSACWQYSTRAECDMHADECIFEEMLGFTYTAGSCTEDQETGWCAPRPFGGSLVSTIWWEPSTGRIVLMGVFPNDYPPGWEICSSPDSGTGCPSTVEACQVCVCEGVGSSGE